MSALKSMCYIILNNNKKRYAIIIVDKREIAILLVPCLLSIQIPVDSSC